MQTSKIREIENFETSKMSHFEDSGDRKIFSDFEDLTPKIEDMLLRSSKVWEIEKSDRSSGEESTMESRLKAKSRLWRVDSIQQRVRIDYGESTLALR